MPWSPESRARAAERMRKLNADPEFKAKHAEAAAERMRKLNADPEFKAATAERMRKLHADPEFKAKHAFLADLSVDDRRFYQKLRNCGLTREEALAEIARATTSAAPVGVGALA